MSSDNRELLVDTVARIGRSLNKGLTQPQKFATQSRDALQKLSAVADESALASPAKYGPDLIQSILRESARDLLNSGLRPWDPDTYVAGTDIACSVGKIVHRTDMFELIQYYPQEQFVGARALLLVAPLSRNFMILDLLAQHSLTARLLENGFQVFTLSWRDAEQHEPEKSFSDFAKSLIDAIAATLIITQQDSLNAAGLSEGGVLLSAVAAYMAAIQDDRLASVTLMDSIAPGEGASGVDYSSERLSDSLLFRAVEEMVDAGKGLFDIFFELLKDGPIELVRQLLELFQTTTAFDTWNDDRRTIPRKVLREFEKVWKDADESFEVLGTLTKLANVRIPVFALSSQYDRVVPWKQAYGMLRRFSGANSFLLNDGFRYRQLLESADSADNHNFYVAPASQEGFKRWREHADHRNGVWWVYWMRWLNGHVNGSKTAPPGLGDNNEPQNYPPLYAAPGQYAKSANRVPDVQISLPADDSIKKNTPLQWWYWTGHLVTDSGRHFGFQVAVFVGDREGFPTTTTAQAAISDVENKNFVCLECEQFGHLDVIPNKFHFDLHNESILAKGGNGEDQLAADIGDYSLSLQLHAEVPATRHYQGGRHDYVIGGNTYYYSRTRLRTQGSIRTPDGTRHEVVGTAWFDRQWGDLMNAVQRGWQWFAITLDDDRQIMLYVFNRAPQEAMGSITSPDGISRPLERAEFDIDTTHWWTSPNTGISYPHGWNIRVLGENLTVTPVLQDQELQGRFWIGPRYWEGACEVTGTTDGRAYAELVGSGRQS